MKLGLVGFPLGHSLSPKIFDSFFQLENLPNCSYELFPVKEARNILPLAEKNELLGFNVTVPHKEEIISYLDELESDCERIGAVNTVVRKNHMWWGYNTDVLGFSRSIEKEIFKENKALILGTGGSSKAVCTALSRLGWEFQVVSRQKSKADLIYSDLLDLSGGEYSLIVNTTPLGMHPEVDNCPPIPEALIDANTFLFDLVYKPEKTRFLKLGESKGARTKNGLEMLNLQAEASWNIWKEIGF